jgi:hypothetical protein
MVSRARKVTFSLHDDVLAALDEAVARGGARSKNAFVEQALRREFQEMRRQSRQAQWEEASRDPLFLKDLEDIGDAFASADAETMEDVR